MENLENKTTKPYYRTVLGGALDILFVPTAGIRTERVIRKSKGNQYDWMDTIPTLANEFGKAIVYGNLIPILYNLFKG